MAAWSGQLKSSEGVKGNKKGWLGLQLQRKGTRIALVIATMGVALAGLLWHEELGQLLRPGAAAGVVTTTKGSGGGNGAAASFSWSGPPAAHSSLVVTHVEGGGGGQGQHQHEQEQQQEEQQEQAGAGDDDDDGGPLTEAVEEGRAGSTALEEPTEAEGEGASPVVTFDDAAAADDATAFAAAGDGDDDESLMGLGQQEEEEEEGEAVESLLVDQGADDDDDAGLMAAAEALEEEEEEEEEEWEEWGEEEENDWWDAEEEEEEAETEEEEAATEPVRAAPVLTEEEAAAQLLAECDATYGQRRHFLPKGEEVLPPVLYSFPGAHARLVFMLTHVWDPSIGLMCPDAHSCVIPLLINRSDMSHTTTRQGAATRGHGCSSTTPRASTRAASSSPRRRRRNSRGRATAISGCVPACACLRGPINCLPPAVYVPLAPLPPPHIISSDQCTIPLSRACVDHGCS
jgi:hypothetical protein